VKQDNATAENREKGSDNSGRYIRPEFSEIISHLPRQRHPNWPAKLQRLNIFANDAA